MQIAAEIVSAKNAVEINQAMDAIKPVVQINISVRYTNDFIMNVK